MKFNVEQLVNRAQGIVQDAIKSDNLVAFDQIDFVDEIESKEVQKEVADIFLQNTTILSSEACYYLQKIVNPMEAYPYPVHDPLMRRDD